MSGLIPSFPTEQSTSVPLMTESHEPTHVTEERVQRDGHSFTPHEHSSTGAKVHDSMTQSNLGSEPAVSTGRARRIANIAIGASATLIGHVASKVAGVGKKIFDQAQKLRSADGRLELKKGIERQAQQLKTKLESLQETTSKKLQQAKAELPGRISKFADEFPGSVRSSVKKIKEATIKFFQQLRSSEGRKELKKDFDAGMTRLKNGAIALMEKGSQKASQMKKDLQLKLDAYEAKGEGIVNDAKGAVQEKWKSLTASKEKTETIATSDLSPLSETQGPSSKELLGELMKESRKLRDEGTFSDFKLGVDKEGHFKLKERKAGLNVRQGSSDKARHTLETVIKVLQNSLKDGELTPNDATDIANMRRHLEKQMDATLRHNPELLSDFNRAFDDVEAHMVYLPTADGTRTMLEHFDKDKAVLFKVFEFIGAKDNKILVDGEVYTLTTISTAADQLSSGTVAAFERYRQDGDLEALKKGQTNAKFARVLKTGMLELIKAGMKEMDKDYKTSESQLAKDYRDIEAMFAANASSKGVAMDWDKLSAFIERFGKEMENFSRSNS